MLYGFVWKCSVPHCTQWFCWSLSRFEKWLFQWEYTPFSDIPKMAVCYWKWLFIVDFPMKNLVIFQFVMWLFTRGYIPSQVHGSTLNNFWISQVSCANLARTLGGPSRNQKMVGFGVRFSLGRLPIISFLPMMFPWNLHFWKLLPIIIVISMKNPMKNPRSPSPNPLIVVGWGDAMMSSAMTTMPSMPMLTMTLPNGQQVDLILYLKSGIRLVKMFFLVINGDS